MTCGTSNPRSGAAVIPLPEKQYTVIYADPPWAYSQGGKTKSSHGIAKQHYPTMTTAEIFDMPIRSLCAAGGGYGLFHVGHFPQYRGGHKGHGGVGVSV